MMDAIVGKVVEYVDIRTSLVFVTIFLLVSWLFSKPKTNIPGPTALPFLGNLITLLSHRKSPFVDNILAWRRQYGDIFGLYFGHQLVVFLTKKEDIHDAFVNQANVFSNRPHWLPGLKDVIPKARGIVWSSGDMWRLQRRLALHSMREFGLGKQSLEERILDECDHVMNVFTNNKEKEFSTRSTVKKAVSNITHSIIFGDRREYDDPVYNGLMSDFDIIFGSSGVLNIQSFFPWLKYLRGDNITPRTEAITRIKDYIRQQADEHKKTFSKEYIRDFIDIYIDHNNEDNDHSLTKDDLMQMIFNLFAAGTDTTSASIDWCFMSMLKHPHVQVKCYEDIMKVVGNGRPVKLSDRTKLKYIDATLMEVQRLGNVAGGSLPHTPTEDARVGNYIIPKGTVVLGSFASVHKDKSAWDDPETFNPDRFLDGHNNIKKNGNFMPFSIGPRVCPGESLAKTVMFLIFTNVLQRFRLEKNNENDKLTYQGVTGLTTQPKPFQVKLFLRD